MTETTSAGSRGSDAMYQVMFGVPQTSTDAEVEVGAEEAAEGTETVSVDSASVETPTVPVVVGAPTAARSAEDTALLARIAAEAGGTAPAAPFSMPFSELDLGANASRDQMPESLLASPTAARTYMTTQPISSQIASVSRSLETVQSRSAEVHRQREAVKAVISAIQREGTNADKEVDLQTIEVTDSDGNRISAAALLSRVGLLDQFVSGGKATATIQSLETFSESLDSRANEISTGTQTSMIQMQELLHQRNLLIQLATTELSSREQLERKIVENIR